MPEIGLLTDASEQVDEPARPKDLYASELFRAMRAYAERRHDEWWVLSREHGLLGPEGPPIAPYDSSLADATSEERREWARRVADDLDEVGLLNPHAVLVVHPTGNHHAELSSLLRETDAETRVPTEGLDADERLAWYDERLD